MEGIDFPRIMLPRALRGSFLVEKSPKHVGSADCEMRIGFLLISVSRKRKLFEDSNAGIKRRKEC